MHTMKSVFITGATSGIGVSSLKFLFEMDIMSMRQEGTSQF